MRHRVFSRLALVGAAALLTGLSGCVVAPVGPAYAVDDGYYHRGPPPVVGYVWIDGYWTWQAGRRNWVGGHWGPPHRPRGYYHRGR